MVVFFSLKNTVVVRTQGLENRLEVTTVSEHHGQLVPTNKHFFFGEGKEQWKEPLHDWRDHTAVIYENTPRQAILRGKGAHILFFFIIVNPQLADIWVPVIPRLLTDLALRSHWEDTGTNLALEIRFLLPSERLLLCRGEPHPASSPTLEY